MDKIKVLHAKMKLSSDGATSVLLNMARELENEVRFDFLLYEAEGNDWAWKFEELGSRIYYREAKETGRISHRRERTRLYRQFFKEYPYEIVHIDTDNIARLDVLSCAENCGIKRRIYHSHNSKSEGRGILYRFPPYVGYAKNRIAKLSTDLCACSKEAAEWMFPHKYLSEVKIIKNGIDTDKFQFNPDARTKIRREYGLEDALVIGCVARFVEQKNHSFLIQIFSEVAKENNDARLILIGDGELKDSVQKMVEELCLSDKVLFAGPTDSVEEYMSAMDIYVMPSLFEGLGIVFLEAQASGLYCITSDRVPREVCVSDKMEFLSLDDGPHAWSEKILSRFSPANCLDRQEAYKEVADAGYDIKTASRKLLEIYKGISE